MFKHARGLSLWIHPASFYSGNMFSEAHHCNSCIQDTHPQERNLERNSLVTRLFIRWFFAFGNNAFCKMFMLCILAITDDKNPVLMTPPDKHCYFYWDSNLKYLFWLIKEQSNYPYLMQDCLFWVPQWTKKKCILSLQKAKQSVDI